MKNINLRRYEIEKGVFRDCKQKLIVYSDKKLLFTSDYNVFRIWLHTTRTKAVLEDLIRTNSITNYQEYFGEKELIFNFEELWDVYMVFFWFKHPTTKKDFVDFLHDKAEFKQRFITTLENIEKTENQPGLLELKQLIKSIRELPEIRKVQLMRFGDKLNHSRIDVTPKKYDGVYDNSILREQISNQVKQVELKLKNLTSTDWCLEVDATSKSQYNIEGTIVNA